MAPTIPRTPALPMVATRLDSKTTARNLAKVVLGQSTAKQHPASRYGQQDFGQPSAQPAGTGYPSYPGAENTSGSYGAGGYPSAPAYDGVEIQERNTLAPWALGLSIAAIVFAISIIGLIIAWLPALVGLILSIIAVLRAKKIQGPYRRMGMSVASLIISGLTTALLVIGIIGFSILMANSGEAIQKCQNDYPTNSSAQQQCINDAVQDALGG